MDDASLFTFLIVMCIWGICTLMQAWDSYHGNQRF